MFGIQTFWGPTFDFEAPKAEHIGTAHQLATVLSRIPRFNGHSRLPYPVAHHAVLVAWMLEEIGAPLDTQLWGLHHDTPEAFIGDLSSPLLRYLREKCPEFREVWEGIESKTFLAIQERFKFPATRLDHWKAIKRMDLCALEAERRVEMKEGPSWDLPIEECDHTIIAWAADQLFELKKRDAVGVFVRTHDRLCSALRNKAI